LFRGLGLYWWLLLAATSLATPPCLAQTPAPAPAAGGKRLTIGQSIALSGPLAPVGNAYHQGAGLVFEHINAQGGIDGKRIEWVVLDDESRPDKALENTRQLLDQGVLALFGMVGSPQVLAAYAALKDSDALLYAPSAGADELRGPLYPNIYTTRPGFSEEAAVVTRHAETLGARRLVILHGPDPESLHALDSAQRTTTAIGSNLLASLPLESVNQALAAKPQAVLILGDAPSAAQAIRALRQQAYRGPIYAFSNTGENLLAQQLGSTGAGVVLVRVVPKSDHARTAVVRDLLAQANARGWQPNIHMLEGYIAARSLVQALQRSGKDPTRASLRRSIDTMTEVDVGGFRIHFAGDRVGSRVVELGLIDSKGRVRD
jgi:ABC-type branched-subunit amino acid transport system substrate-binding protein